MRKRAIKNIWIMTLEAIPNRKWGCLGALDARLFPMDQVNTVHGVDGLTYNSHDESVPKHTCLLYTSDAADE